jgi:hypothetical protein
VFVFQVEQGKLTRGWLCLNVLQLFLDLGATLTLPTAKSLSE